MEHNVFFAQIQYLDSTDWLRFRFLNFLWFNETLIRSYKLTSKLNLLLWNIQGKCSDIIVLCICWSTLANFYGGNRGFVIIMGVGVRIGAGVCIGAGVRIGAGVKIGGGGTLLSTPTREISPEKKCKNASHVTTPSPAFCTRSISSISFCQSWV